ncbi:kinase-like protein [Histomonas meleagridis]|uniref:kinase-like protein n=1 Tax=Histomonas meleagridis TaxID=135588 RepID=UPI003559F878|nr:kinase-like protein [Histomonas meleagridis]KAH0803643.1 kinase-like protein [Histomonas meleagridis]
MVHTDLKLENILLKGGLVNREGRDIETGRDSMSIRLIDFGSLDSGSAWHYHLVTTRHYRAPEILMGLRWGYECDIWSLGCILVELSLGRICFDARDLIEHLYLIQHMIGPIPKKMWVNCTINELRPFIREGHIRSSSLNRQAYEEARRKPTLRRILDFDSSLSDLALWLLNPDPDERPRTDSILRHPFFNVFHKRSSFNYHGKSG